MIKKLPKEQKSQLIGHIQYFFQMERGEEIGDLAAESILMFMLNIVGPVAYNEAIKDARSIINERNLSLEDELYTLEKPMKLMPRTKP